MKKLNYITYIATLALSLGFVSCSDDDNTVDYSRPPIAVNGESQSVVELEATVTSGTPSYSLTFTREESTNALSLPITITPSTTGFSFPSTVDFAAGSTSATYTIDIASGLYGFYTFTGNIASSTENAWLRFNLGFELTLPASVGGVEDASVDATDPDNTYVSVEVSGSGFAPAKLAVISANDFYSQITAVMNGTIESIDVTTAGTYQLPFDYESETGDYYVALISYSGATVTGVSTTEFSYVAEWSTIAGATYTDGLFWPVISCYGEPYMAIWSPKVQESSTEPGLYRIMNLLSGYTGSWFTVSPVTEPYYVIINATNPEQVYMERSNIGQTYSSSTYNEFEYVYGSSYTTLTNIVVTSYAYEMMQKGATDEEITAAGAWGTLEDGVITFPRFMLGISFNGWSDCDIANGSEFYPANQVSCGFSWDAWGDSETDEPWGVEVSYDKSEAAPFALSVK